MKHPSLRTLTVLPVFLLPVLIGCASTPAQQESAVQPIVATVPAEIIVVYAGTVDHPDHCG